MPSSLDSTYGIWLIALFLETMYDVLYGAGLLQAWLYFHWYSKDHWGVKTMASCDSRTRFSRKLGQLLAGVILVLVEMGASIGIIELGSFTFLTDTKAIFTLHSSAAAACDIVITFSLVRTLGKRKRGIRSTNSMLNMLIINAINRGILTTICATLTMILFLALPGQFFFFYRSNSQCCNIYTKIISQSLNSRQHILNKSSELEWQSIPIGTISSSRVVNNSSEVTRIQVVVDNETYRGCDRKKTAEPKSTFIDGML
ncbi:hypothetical protein BDQ12DRAFT_771671 [Crucibulum laeve]|uniref:DUF6534 domain-containing protein n=1 Tax=Crucibulum laeve TaxID=68775 RepID=A0A5C3LII4_9AGAR|nr:hypothetical protein BDQ12DRAFT_771671 [Crucibulum laeve]